MPNAIFISNFKIQFLSIMEDILFGTESPVLVSYCYVANHLKIHVILAHEPVSHLGSPPGHSQAHFYVCWSCSSWPVSFTWLASHRLVEDGFTWDSGALFCVTSHPPAR